MFIVGHEFISNYFIDFLVGHARLCFEVLKASIRIVQMVIKLGVSTAKIKYLTKIYVIDQNVYHLCFAATFMSTWAHLKSERDH